MFENTPDATQIRAALTDAGHTAAGFVALAAKRATELTGDFSERYETQIADNRKRALELVTRVESTRDAIEARVEPVVARITERLPEPAQKAVADLTAARKQLQERAHDLVVKAITTDVVPMPKPASPASEAAAPSTRARRTTGPGKAAASAKTATRTVKKTAASAKSAATKAARKPRAAKTA